MEHGGPVLTDVEGASDGRHNPRSDVEQGRVIRTFEQAQGAARGPSVTEWAGSAAGEVGVATGPG